MTMPSTTPTPETVAEAPSRVRPPSPVGPPPRRPAPPISRAAFEAMLADPAIPDRAIRPYVMLDPLAGGPLMPQVIPNPARVDYGEAESAAAMASLNGVARWRRLQAYRQRIAAGWRGPRVVAEGDSWFQYPFLIDDVVDHLSGVWAIHCLSAAGDMLSDMARQDEVGVTVRAERPDLLILSGGGNDVLGAGLGRCLLPWRQGARADDLIGPGFAPLLGATLGLYGNLIETGLSAGAPRVVCHSYDRVIAANGRWLGQPLARLGIVDPALQSAVLGLLIDRFHAGLTALAGRFGGRVIVADCRGSVPRDQWHDELHPTSFGFRGPAGIIRAAARHIGLGEAVPGGLESVDLAPPEEAVAPARPLPVADAAAIEALLALPEAALINEIGRRDTLISLRPDAARTLTLEVAPVGLEGVGDAFAALGQRLFGRWHRELYGLVCGPAPADAAARDELRGALGLGETAMVGALTAALSALGCPPLLAPMIAILIVKKGIYPAWEETCAWWGQQLDPAPPQG